MGAFGYAVMGTIGDTNAGTPVAIVGTFSDAVTRTFGDANRCEAIKSTLDGAIVGQSVGDVMTSTHTVKSLTRCTTSW